MNNLISILPKSHEDKLKHSLLISQSNLESYQITNSHVSNDLNFKLNEEVILICFCIRGKITLSCEEYITVINAEEYFLFSDKEPFPQLTFKCNSPFQVVLLAFTFNKFHSYFGEDFEKSDKNNKIILKKYPYKFLLNIKKATPGMMTSIYSLIHNNLTPPSRDLYILSKIMEFMSLFIYQVTLEDDQKKCPFIISSQEEEKINLARDTLIENLVEPPTIKELAKIVGTNEYKLKYGFKSIFGNTIYGFYRDYRMYKARQLLEQNNYSVSEVAYLIGYSNPSHFISCYKQIFGITPKKFLMQISS